MPDIELKKIQPNKLNPRLKFSKAGLDDLAASIKQYGILEPILVRPVNGHYEVVVGERRYRAAQQAGLDTVPVVVKEYSDEEVMEVNLVENVQREDLSAVEKAKLCQELRRRFSDKYQSWDALARRIGVEPSTVRTWMRTLGLPEEVQEMIAPRETQRVPEGRLDYRTALEIAQWIKEPSIQAEVAAKLADEPLPRKVREEVIRRAATQQPARVERESRETPKEEVSRIVQEVSREVRPTMVFSHRHYRAVLDGTKTQSTRRRPDPQIQKGALVRAAVTHFADLEITDVVRKRLGEFTDEDARREGGYNLTEFQEYWRRLNGDWNPDEVVYLINFHVARVR
ncbi:MAG: ParB/RepB/Spo0J family partition protein [Chloroflexi bacterium]|nr:ParB/RepB/Spo0J family partition protein [Chloroflexota bacterium]